LEQTNALLRLRSEEENQILSTREEPFSEGGEWDCNAISPAGFKTSPGSCNVDHDASEIAGKLTGPAVMSTAGMSGAEAFVQHECLAFFIAPQSPAIFLQHPISACVICSKLTAQAKAGIALSRRVRNITELRRRKLTGLNILLLRLSSKAT
jgi:hypothetical protein